MKVSSPTITTGKSYRITFSSTQRLHYLQPSIAYVAVSPEEFKVFIGYFAFSIGRKTKGLEYSDWG